MPLARETLLDRLWSRYNSARGKYESAQNTHDAVDWTPPTDTAWRATADEVGDILQDLINAVSYLVDFNFVDYDFWYLVVEYCNHYAAPVTCQAIIEAYEVGTHDEYCQMISWVDYMRKEIWDEPYIKYLLAEE